MVGFTEPNRYEPRLGWRVTLEQWMNDPPADNTSWQHHIGRYWTAAGSPQPFNAGGLEGASHGACHGEGGSRCCFAGQWLCPARTVQPRAGAVAGDRHQGRRRRRQCGHRGRAGGGKPPDKVEDGFSEPPKYSRTIYQPRSRWMQKLVTAPGNATGWLADLHLYWRHRTLGGMSVKDAWKEVKMDPNNAGIAIHKDNADRGAIPPELIGRVVARAGNEDRKRLPLPRTEAYKAPAGPGHWSARTSGRRVDRGRRKQQADRGEDAVIGGGGGVLVRGVGNGRVRNRTTHVIARLPGQRRRPWGRRHRSRPHLGQPCCRCRTRDRCRRQS